MLVRVSHNEVEKPQIGIIALEDLNDIITIWLRVHFRVMPCANLLPTILLQKVVHLTRGVWERRSKLFPS